MQNYIIPKFEKPSGENLSEYLSASIEAFSNITNIPVTFYNNDNEIVKEFNADQKICNIFDVYNKPGSVCRENLASSISFAARLGEPYVFLCRAGLAHFATTLLVDGKALGCFIAGPIVMGNLRESTTKKFIQLNNLPSSTIAVLPHIIKSMPIYAPKEINQIALLFYNCIISATGEFKSYEKLSNRYSDQGALYDNIKDYKKRDEEISYPYELEHNLIKEINLGNIPNSISIFREFIKQVSVLESGDLPAIKTKLLWLFAIISRRTSTQEHISNDSAGNTFDIILSINELESYSDLLSTSEKIIEKICANMISSVYKGNSPIIINALKFINSRFKEKIGLHEIEDELHVNPSYFSTLFKQEMGQTFVNYLNSTRIKYACSLLTQTNLSVLDISLASGFEDQSYFTKVFNKEIGKTPKQYRHDALKG